MLRVEDLSVRLGTRTVVRHVSLTVRGGELVGLLGPNGAGKSSLLRGIMGLVPASGTSSLRELPPAERARAAAWLPQAREIAWPVPVEDLVALGRIPCQPRWAGPAGAALAAPDREAVDRALSRTGLTAMRGRPATELSGGEQARLLIARALAQDTPLLLADEPVAGLDPAQALMAMDTFRDLSRDGKGIVLALHDLTLAARYCSRLILMSDGEVVTDGPPEQVLTSEMMQRVYGLRARMHGRDVLVEGLA